MTVAVNPSGVTATNASTGSFITPAASVSNGTTEPVSGTIEITAPGTTTVTPPVTTVPGAPNTGAGGNAAMNFALIALSGLVVIGASAYALRRS